MTPTRRCKEKFGSAIYCLAVREGDVRERLLGAYRYLHMLTESEIPPEYRGEWREILDACTRYGPDIDADGTVYFSAVEHTMKRIKNCTGRRISERIYRLAREIA